MTPLRRAGCWEGGGVGGPGLCSKPALPSQGPAHRPALRALLVGNSAYPSARSGAAPRTAPAAPGTSARRGSRVHSGAARPRDGDHKGCCYLCPIVSLSSLPSAPAYGKLHGGVGRFSNTPASGALVWELRRAVGTGPFLISPAAF